MEMVEELLSNMVDFCGQDVNALSHSLLENAVRGEPVEF